MEKHVYERKIDRMQGLNVLLDFLADMFDYRHYILKRMGLPITSKRKARQRLIYLK